MSCMAKPSLILKAFRRKQNKAEFNPLLLYFLRFRQNDVNPISGRYTRPAAGGDCQARPQVEPQIARLDHR